MITQDKLTPTFSIHKCYAAPSFLDVDYVINDLGYLSECKASFIVQPIYRPAYNCTDWYLVNPSRNYSCKISVFNNHSDLEGLVEYLNKKPYENFLKLKDYGLIK